jgi:hypothetical protein
MNRSFVAAIVMLAIPIVAFVGGAKVMDGLSGRKEVPKPKLNLRFHYDRGDAEKYWNGFKDIGAEQRFLELDLVFPFLYAGALAAGLLMAWARLGRTFHPAWILVPLFIVLVADWTENLVQISQLKRHLAGIGVQEGWIQVASAATALKLSLFYASWLALFVLVGRVLWRALRGA